MKATYDQETDSLTIVLHEGEVSESDELRPGVIVDFDNQGRIVAIELLHASRHVSDPMAFSYELKAAANP
ncbi:MAG: hypothetical protein A2V67_03330 [Deltaproteobacteria bacterium RBG_13_61_14]|nr:MAG: hypothetical protein A2V67_03330 [Deltaproteobacteria bacterium RBG_13_61_14]